MAFKLVGVGEKIPPISPSLQVPPVAEPPTEPPSADELVPWHIALRAEPAFAVGKALTVTSPVVLIHPENQPGQKARHWW